MTKANMPVDIRPLRSADRPDWQRLWTDDLTFYKTSVSAPVHDMTFARLLGEDAQDFSCHVTKFDGKLVGLTQDDDAPARALCDRIGTTTNFVTYQRLS